MADSQGESNRNTPSSRSISTKGGNRKHQAGGTSPGHVISDGAAKKRLKHNKEQGGASAGSALRGGGKIKGPTTAAPRFSVEPQGMVLPRLRLLLYAPER